MRDNIITISPDIQSGTPGFSNTRVPVKNFIDYLKGGDRIEECLDDSPSVTREQVFALLKLVEQMITFTPHAPHEKNAADENFPKR